MATFKQKTIDTVIIPLRNKLATMVGQSFPTKGHFYREIEILKFPYLLSDSWRPNTGKNVYAGQQYETIVDYFISLGMIKFQYHTNRIEVHVSGSTTTSTQPIQENPSCISITEGPNTLDLHLDMYNCYELVLFNGEELSIKELKAINQNGLVYHSEILGVDYENEDDQIEYMNIYYFAKVNDITKLFGNFLPY